MPTKNAYSRSELLNVCSGVCAHPWPELGGLSIMATHEVTVGSSTQAGLLDLLSWVPKVVIEHSERYTIYAGSVKPSPDPLVTIMLQKWGGTRRDFVTVERPPPPQHVVLRPLPLAASGMSMPRRGCPSTTATSHEHSWRR